MWSGWRHRRPPSRAAAKQDPLCSGAHAASARFSPDVSATGTLTKTCDVGRILTSKTSTVDALDRPLMKNAAREHYVWRTADFRELRVFEWLITTTDPVAQVLSESLDFILVWCVWRLFSSTSNRVHWQSATRNCPHPPCETGHPTQSC